MQNFIKNKVTNQMQISQQNLNLFLIPRSQKNRFIKELNQKSQSTSNFIDKSQSNFNSTFKGNTILRQTRKNGSLCINQLQWEVCQQINGRKIIKRRIKDLNLNGYVELQYINGNSFKGIYQNGLRISGIMIYKNQQCQYEGGFCGQKFYGYGKLKYYNGRTIQGEWQNKFFVGSANITYPNGDIYYGQVNQHLYKHGEGYLFLYDGSKYIGSFENGSITGFGTFYKSDQTMIKGVWMKGKLMKQISSQQFTNSIKTKKNNQKQYSNKLDYHFQYSNRNQTFIQQHEKLN